MSFAAPSSSAPRRSRPESESRSAPRSDCLCSGGLQSAEAPSAEEILNMAVMMRTMLDVADNSGARKLQMILPLGGSTGLSAGLGDVITAAVKESAPEGQVQKGKVVKA